MKLFGFEIKRQKEEEQQQKVISFVPPATDDGALTVTSGGIYGTYVDLDGSVRTEAELVTKYRAIAQDPIVDLAIQDIVNEAIIEDSDEDTISLMLDNVDTTESIKKKIKDEFQNILKLTEFNRISYEIFKRWYVDGRLYYHVIIDNDKPKDGILEVRYIDPRHIKKVREVKKETTDMGAVVEKVVAEYYIYNASGFMKRAGSENAYGSSASLSSQGLKIAKDSIVYCTSGYLNEQNTLILSYLHKAIRPLNQLRSMEDSLIIYRISRAPERRIFYVDVGGLPKGKAEQYLADLMTRFKNKVVYDSSTGEIRDDRKFMTMLEDFWLPRREGGRGTEISTLPGGQNLGEIEDVIYFQNILYRSLNVPVTRLQPESTFTLGRSTEISRDEVKFSKFIVRLRNKFGELFTKLLERQLLLKGICKPEDWANWKHAIEYDFAVDNYFLELKNMEILRERIGILRDMDEYVGRYYSNDWIRKYVLQQNELEMDEIDKEIKSEKTDDRYAGLEPLDTPDMAEPERRPEPEPTPTPVAPGVQQNGDDIKQQINGDRQITDEEKHLATAMTHFFESMS